jgi:hypothetical protein
MDLGVTVTVAFKLLKGPGGSESESAARAPGGPVFGPGPRSNFAGAGGVHCDTASDS